MKRPTFCCAILVLCLATGMAATGPAAAVTAIVTGKAEVYKTPQEVVDTLDAGAKVTTGTVNGEWVAVSYRKADEETDRQGWVNAALLEEVPAGYDSRVSEHIILHAQDPANVDRFDMKVAEELYRSISRSLVNGENEPRFAPNVKLRVYLFSPQTFKAQAKRASQPDDAVAFSPVLGQAYLDFSLRTATPPMKAVIVHETARLILRDYSMQPQGRPGAGGPLPLWIVEAFATYHEFQAGYNTDNLLYVPDKPRLSSLVNKRSLPRRFEDRRAYQATAGALGYMLLNHGTSEQFSQFLRRLQTDGGRTRGSALLYEFYGMTPASFRSEWVRYIELLKEKHNIKRLEDEIEEGDDDGGPLSQNTTGVTNPVRAEVERAIGSFLPGDAPREGTRLFLDRFFPNFFK